MDIESNSAWHGVRCCNRHAGDIAVTGEGTDTMSRKPKVRTEKYVVDVCFGGCFALFPDNTIRLFRDQPECLAAIKANATARKREVLVSRIEWQFRSQTVTEDL